MSATSTIKLTKGYKDALEKIKLLESQTKEANRIIERAAIMDTIGDCIEVHNMAEKYEIKYLAGIDAHKN